VPEVDGRPLDGYCCQLAAFPKSASTVTFHLAVASGDWTTVYEHGPTGSHSIEGRRVGGTDWTVSFTSAVENADGSTVVNLSYTCVERDTRVIAVDQGGQEHTPSRSEGSVIGNVRQLTATFQNLPVKQIKEVRFQARPYHLVEFRGVSLQPGTTATSKVGPAASHHSIGPAIDRVIVDGQKVIVEGWASTNSRIVFGFDQGGSQSCGFLKNDRFTATLKPAFLGKGLDIAVVDAEGNVLLTSQTAELNHVRFRPDRIVFRKGPLQPEPDGAYVIADVRPDNGPPLPLKVRLESRASQAAHDIPQRTSDSPAALGEAKGAEGQHGQGQAEGPLQVSALPTGWKLKYNGANGIDFYSVATQAEGSGLLMFSRWPPPSKPEDIPALVRQIADGFANSAKKQPGLALTSEKHTLEPFTGDHCKGTYAVFRLGGAGAGTVQTMFAMSVDGQTWNGQFTGRPGDWAEALKLLATLKIAETADKQILGGPGRPSVGPVAGSGDRPQRAVEQQPAQSQPDRRAFEAQLSDGVTVELLGVSENPSKDRPWWRPDGSPLAQRPYDLLGASVAVGKDEMAREIAVRLRDLPSEPVGVQWQVQPTSGLSTREPPGLANSMPDVRAIAVRMPANQDTARVRIGVAAGPWRTVSESGDVQGATAVGSAESGTVFSKPEEKDGNTTITVVHDIADQEVRVVTVGADGREHRGSPGQFLSAGKVTQLTVAFPKLSLKEVKAFRLQSRPYQWVEFRNVSLQPGQKTDVQVLHPLLPNTPAAAPAP
jgi:hypothetical protein